MRIVETRIFIAASLWAVVVSLLCLFVAAATLRLTEAHAEHTLLQASDTVPGEDLCSRAAIERLIVELGDNSFEVRERAQRRLEDLAPQYCIPIPLIMGRIRSPDTDAEVKGRLTQVLRLLFDSSETGFPAPVWDNFTVGLSQILTFPQAAAEIERQSAMKVLHSFGPNEPMSEFELFGLSPIAALNRLAAMYSVPSAQRTLLWTINEADVSYSLLPNQGVIPNDLTVYLPDREAGLANGYTEFAQGEMPLHDEELGDITVPVPVSMILRTWCGPPIAGIRSLMINARILHPLFRIGGDYEEQTGNGANHITSGTIVFEAEPVDADDAERARDAKARFQVPPERSVAVGNTRATGWLDYSMSVQPNEVALRIENLSIDLPVSLFWARADHGPRYETVSEPLRFVFPNVPLPPCSSAGADGPRDGAPPEGEGGGGSRDDSEDSAAVVSSTTSGAPEACGDGTCRGSAGENCATCPVDCNTTDSDADGTGDCQDSVPQDQLMYFEGYCQNAALYYKIRCACRVTFGECIAPPFVRLPEQLPPQETDDDPARAAPFQALSKPFLEHLQRE